MTSSSQYETKLPLTVKQQVFYVVNVCVRVALVVVGRFIVIECFMSCVFEGRALGFKEFVIL